MELKPYQQEVINDLTKFIDELEKTEQLNVAFSNFWKSKNVPINNIEDDYLKPYDNSIKGVPRVTVKVPTAGGKTFIACNALKPIFDSFPLDKPKVVVWFVPSDTILKQTYKNLNDTNHPYRQKIDSHFGSRVQVYLKQDLLQGASFSPVEVKEQLSIFVLSVQSFTANNKESRKAYQENENLQEFPKTYQHHDKLIENIDETALMQVITQLNPVIIIDESHNFEADLRIDMLNNINPSFIFDLTATPRNKSNIISFVDAKRLKDNNMVKLPVIVYNQNSTNEVIVSAIQLQKTLEDRAIKQKENGGKYIRPIVLFQAQPKTKDDNVTFEKIKQHLIDIDIPEEQIKIKTANKDEIKTLDLMDENCKVRFIITVNALKEGWDCPFAYILASLANKTSSIDVEQILGRILRLPYVTKHQDDLLNYSFVFTSSNNFLGTLDKIIVGLNKSGFSAKDYRVKETQIEKEKSTDGLGGNLNDLFEQTANKNEIDESSTDLEIEPEKIKDLKNSEQNKSNIEDIIEVAKRTNEEYEKKVKDAENDDNLIPEELKNKIKTYPIKSLFIDEVKGITIPTFFKKVKPSLIEQNKYVSLTKSLLLDDFDLSKEDHKIDFNKTATEMFAIDLAESRKDEYVPEYRKVSNQTKNIFAEYISTLPQKSQINQIGIRLSRIIKNIDEIPEPTIKQYIEEAISTLKSDKIAEISNNEYHYANIIKHKINELKDKYAEKQFSRELDKGTVVCKESFKFPKKISPTNTQKGITKNLYVEEGEMNTFEKRVINEVANLESVVFWHRNLERGKGLKLNGFINHYPDFIVKMKNGKIILIETKGDHLDGSDSLKKLRLGEKWASKAGDNYRYFMVFENKKLDGAKDIGELLDILRDMD